MQQRPAMAYVVPDFHNPTGRLMPDSQRRRLVRAAAAAGTVLVVDETLRELNLDGVPSTPLAAFSPAVVSIGSLSKSHWAGLRTGWIRPASPSSSVSPPPAPPWTWAGPWWNSSRRPTWSALAEPLPARLAALRGNRDTLLELIAGNLPTGRRNGPTAGCPSGAGCRRRSARR